MLDLGEGSLVGFNVGLSVGKGVGTSVGIDELGFSISTSIGFRSYMRHQAERTRTAHRRRPPTFITLVFCSI
jgi:hypothetical protein